MPESPFAKVKVEKIALRCLPVNLAPVLQRHLQKVKVQHEQDIDDGFGHVHLPDALTRKFPSAAREWGWQYVFPSSRISLDPRTAMRRRHHVDENVLQLALKKAARAQPELINGRAVTLCGTLSRRICLKMATTSALCRNFSATRT
jgi:hypothetical protein